MMRTTVWPASWNSRSFWRTTVWPRWMSAAVGSSPSLTRSGRPPASFSASAPRGSSSTALRTRCAAVPAASGAGSSIRANASVLRPAGLVRPPDTPPRAPTDGDAPDPAIGRTLEAGPHRPMSDSERTSEPAALQGEGAANGNGDGGATVLHLPLSHRRRGSGDGDGSGEGPRRRVRIRKLRVLALLTGLGLLAAVSTVFGMMMAVASDLPQMEDPLRGNSVMLDANGHEIGLLTGDQRQLFVSEAQIAPVMKHAIIAIEDRRFYTNEGYDLRG